jgi:hypothetical protein
VGVRAALVRHVPALAQQARALETNPLELFPQAFSGRPDAFCVRSASLWPYAFATASGPQDPMRRTRGSRRRALTTEAPRSCR